VDQTLLDEKPEIRLAAIAAEETIKPTVTALCFEFYVKSAGIKP